MTEFNSALSFVLIKQITVALFSYAIRNYIQCHDFGNSNKRFIGNLWRKTLGEILKGFFVTVEI